MSKRHEDLARPRARQSHVILHHRIAADKAVLDPQPFENPLRRMPLLRRRRLVGLEDRVDHRNQRSELRLFRLLGPHVARRRRKAAHLGDRLSAQSENPRRLAPALSLDENKPSNRCISLHRKHPRPPFRIKIRKRSASQVAGFYSATQPQNAAAPWPTIAPPRTMSHGPCIRSTRLRCKLSESTQRNAREHDSAHAARTAFQISGAVLPLMRSLPSLN